MNNRYIHPVGSIISVGDDNERVWKNVKILVLRYQRERCYYQFLGEQVVDLGSYNKVYWMNVDWEGYKRAKLIS